MGTKKPNIKQANKKWRHEQKRRIKARSEKVRSAQAIERVGRQKNDRRRNATAYVGGLGLDLE